MTEKLQTTSQMGPVQKKLDELNATRLLPKSQQACTGDHRWTQWQFYPGSSYRYDLSFRYCLDCPKSEHR